MMTPALATWACLAFAPPPATADVPQPEAGSASSPSESKPPTPEASPGPVPEPGAPSGAQGGFDRDPSTGAPADETPAFAPVEGDSRPRPSSPAGGRPMPADDEPDGAAPKSAAVGMGATAPLPPPAPPVDPSSITKGPWRGRGYLNLRVFASGPVGGQQPARANVVAFGGEAEIGWRINNWVSLGAGLGGQPHRRVERTVLISGERYYEVADASLMNWDFAVVRFFVPMTGRLQPFLDVAGGLSVLGPLPGESRRIGGQGRASVGTDIWLSRNLSLELAFGYRINAMDDAIGHDLLGRTGLGIHW